MRAPKVCCNVYFYNFAKSKNNDDNEYSEIFGIGHLMIILQHAGHESPFNLFDVADSARKETTLSKIFGIFDQSRACGIRKNVRSFPNPSVTISLKKAWDSSKMSIENAYSSTELGKAEKGGHTDIEIEFNDGIQD